MAGKILFAVDFSPFSESMLGCVAELAQTGMDEIIVVHVMEGAPSEKNEERLAELARKAGEQGLEVRTRLLTGHPVSAIVDAAREEDVDLIYVGSHGKGFLHRHILGSVSDKVVRLADRPVMVIKCDIKEKKDGYDCEQACSRLLGHILVANDFSKYADRVNPALTRFAQAFCTRVTLLNVQESLDIYGGRTRPGPSPRTPRKTWTTWWRWGTRWARTARRWKRSRWRGNRHSRSCRWPRTLVPPSSWWERWASTKATVTILGE